MNIFNTLKYIEIETHSSCNRKCPWCLFGAYPNYRPKTVEFMDTDVIKNIFYDLNDNLFSGAIGLFSINEPLLDPRIVNGDIIRECKRILKNRAIITITTNGDFVTKELADKLFSYGLDEIKISCYNREKYFIMKKVFSSNRNVIILDQTRYLEEKFESNRAGALDKSLNLEANYTSCLYPYYRCAIGWDGEVRICYNDILQRMRIGNVKSKKLSAILNDKNMIAIRKAIESDRKNIIPCCDCNVQGEVDKLLSFNHLINKRLQEKIVYSEDVIFL